MRSSPHYKTNSMRLSQLLSEMQSAYKQFGDLEIGQYPTCFCEDIESERDLNTIKAFRVIKEEYDENTPPTYPGISFSKQSDILDQQEEQQSSHYFAVIFADSWLQNLLTWVGLFLTLGKNLLMVRTISWSLTTATKNPNNLKTGVITTLVMNSQSIHEAFIAR